MKTYPLRIQTLSEWYGYYSKGHHDRQAFCAAVMDGLLDDCTEGITPDNVEYAYWRWIPQPKGSVFDLIAHECDKPGRGVFPVTWIE